MSKTKLPPEALKEPDGRLRCKKTLEVIGYWYEVDGVTYAGSKDEFDKL